MGAAVKVLAVPLLRQRPMVTKVQLQYAAFLKDLPYLGGKKNTHNGTGGKYDCIMIFAYYEAPDHTPDINELYEMNFLLNTLDTIR